MNDSSLKTDNHSNIILIVEDSPTQAEKLKYFLETHGYQVVAASNSKEALALVRLSKPDIVISDIMMPEMDGYELCRQIKTDEKLKDVSVILLTALSDPADVIRGLECGADNFVTKPYDERILLSQIEFLQINRGLQETKSVQMGIEIKFSGRKYVITSDRLQILNILLSIYVSAVGKNRALEQAQDELRRLNEQLEQRVKARTAELAKANEELKLDITERKRAEEALRLSEQKYRTIFDSAPVGIYQSTPDGQFITANDALARIMGYDSVEELLGKNMTDNVYYRKEERAALIREFEPIGSVADLEVQWKKKDGAPIWIQLNAFAVKDKAGRLKHFEGYVRDITERKRGEEVLRKSEAELSNAMEMAHLGSWEYDVVSDLFTFTDSFYAIFRTTAGEVGGYTMSSADYAKRFVHPEDAPVVGEEVRKAIESDDPCYNRQVEHRMLYADGEIGYISVRFFIGKDKKGRTVRTYGVNQDITERKQAEKSLKLFRTLIDHSNDAFEVVDPETGRFLDVNAKSCLELGYSREEYLSLRISDIDPNIEQSLFPTIIGEMRKAGSMLWNSIHRRKNGTTFPVEVNLKYVRLDRAYLVAVARDITERKRAEEELKKSESQFRTVWEDSASGMRITDENGIVFKVNDAFCKMFGKTKEELEGQPLSVIYSSEEKERIQLKHQERFNSRTVATHFEKELKLWNGKRIWVHVTNSFFDLEDEKSLLLGLFTDITERKHAEEALRESEAKYRLMVESSRDAIVISQNNTFIFINDAFANMLGYQKEDLLMNSLKKVYTEEAIKILKERGRKSRNGEAVADRYETVFKKKDGTEVPVEASVRIIDYKGQKAKFAVIRDITKQKEILAALQVSAGQSKGLKNVIPICAGCNKIRDDEKAGKPWVLPPTYISERLPNVNFSHGMCPDCMAKWYPDYVEKKYAKDSVTKNG